MLTLMCAAMAASSTHAAKPQATAPSSPAVPMPEGRGQQQEGWAHALHQR